MGKAASAARSSASAGAPAALVVMTRAPEPGCTKTRMMPVLSAVQCTELHAAMLADVAALCRDLAGRVDVLVSYAPPGSASAVRASFDAPASYFEQRGDSLGDRMREAVVEALQRGYRRCVVVGIDAPELAASDVDEAFALLDNVDVVIGPASDGGFYLIGVKEALRSAFCLSAYGHGQVLAQTVDALARDGRSSALLRTLRDVDCREDAEVLLAHADADADLERLETVRYLRKAL